MGLPGLSVGFTGPGGLDAARAVATDLLAKSHRSRIELIVPEHEGSTLFNTSPAELTELAAVVPGLTITTDLHAALLHVETEMVHRARMMVDHDQHDIAGLRIADPGEPLPTLVLLAGTQQRYAGPLEAALGFSARYGIGAVLLGDWPAGTTCQIDADGQVTHAYGVDAATWTGAQLFHLTATDVADMLQVIRTAHGAEETVPAPPSTVATERPTSESHHDPSALVDAQPPQPPEPDDDVVCRVGVRVLGPVRIEVDGHQITTGLRRISRDLLVLLALHPEGITKEQGIDAIWPEHHLDAGTTMFHTAINNTRTVLRKATGLRESMFITYTGGRYHLDHKLIDADLRRLLAQVEAVARASQDTARIAALQQVAELYSGEFADDLTYEWAETERERIRRIATDALVRLAQLQQAEHPERALDALENAFDHDPYSEPLARELMQAQARLGRLDAVRRTHQLLKHRLNELDVDPDDDTEQLLTTLLRQRTQPRAAVGSEDD